MTDKTFTAGMVPIDAFSAARVDTATKAFGLLLDPRMGPILIDGDGSACMVVPLTGEMAFRHFTLRPGSPVRGLLFTDIEFVVDPNSQFNVHQLNCRGALTFENGSLCMITSPSGDAFDDDMNLPLPFKATSDDGVPVGFSKWSVGKKIGDRFHELWSFDQKPEKL